MYLDRVYNFLISPFSVGSDIRRNQSTIIMAAIGLITLFGLMILLSSYNLRKRKIQVTQNNASSSSPTVQLGLPSQPTQTPIPTDRPISTNREVNTMNPPDIDPERIKRIKDELEEQLGKFEKWAQSNQWGMFSPAHSHYDWFMFPVARVSSYGKNYAVTEDEVKALKADSEFMTKYRRGVELVVRSWGWDLNTGILVEPRTADQRWTGYGVRLGKMGNSLKLFKEFELHRKVQKFYKEVCEKELVRYPLEEWVKEACS